MLKALILAFLTALFGVCGYMGYTLVENKELSFYGAAFLALTILLLSSIICLFAVLYNKERKKLRNL